MSIVLLLSDSEKYSPYALLILVFSLLSFPAFHRILSNKTVSLPIYYFTIDATQTPLMKTLGCALLAVPIYVYSIITLLK